MYHNNKIMAFPVANLADSSLPKALLDYIEKYFLPQTIFGTDCMVAFCTICFAATAPKGVAPSHAVEVDQFKDGLHETTLSSWLRQHSNLYWEFYRSWDDNSMQ